MTTNEMILKTIKTKTTKEAKYAPILADMGYEVIADNGWNGCSCYVVNNPRTNRSVCFSKGYDNKKHLYDGGYMISTFYFEKVDYVGYLNTHRDNTYKRNTPSKYKEMRWKFDHAKWDNWYHGKEIMELRGRIENLEKELEYHINKRDKALQDIDEVHTFILENYNKIS